METSVELDEPVDQNHGANLLQDHNCFLSILKHVIISYMIHLEKLKSRKIQVHSMPIKVIVNVLGVLNICCQRTIHICNSKI